MARIKLGAIVSDISGSVGGSVFLKSQYGISLTNKANPNSRNTASQRLCRSYFSLLQYDWRHGAYSYHGLWDRFSQFKPVGCNHNSHSLLSGYNLFMKYNLIRLSAGLDPLWEPAFSLNGGEQYSYRTSRFSGDLTLIFESDLNIARNWVLFKICPGIGGDYRFVPNRLRVLQLDPAFSNNFNIMDAYEAMYGPLTSTGYFMLAECTFFSTVSPIFSQPVQHPVVYAET